MTQDDLERVLSRTYSEDPRVVVQAVRDLQSFPQQQAHDRLAEVMDRSGLEFHDKQLVTAAAEALGRRGCKGIGTVLTAWSATGCRCREALRSSFVNRLVGGEQVEFQLSEVERYHPDEAVRVLASGMLASLGLRCAAAAH